MLFIAIFKHNQKKKDTLKLCINVVTIDVIVSGNHNLSEEFSQVDVTMGGSDITSNMEYIHTEFRLVSFTNILQIH